MKNILSSFALRVALLFVALAAVSAHTASAQTRTRGNRPVIMLPPFVVSEDPFTPPTLNSDGTLTLPDGTVITPPVRNSDGSITLPDGTVHVLPRPDSDGSIVLPDGTTLTPNEDGTFTLPDGTVVDRAQLEARRGTRPNSGS